MKNELKSKMVVANLLHLLLSSNTKIQLFADFISTISQIRVSFQEI